MYYSSFGILSLVIHIIINFEALRRSDTRGDIELRNRFRIFLFAILLYYVFDIAWGITSDSGIVALTYAYTVLYFISVTLTVVLWIRFVSKFLKMEPLFAKIVSIAAWGVFGAITAIVIVNFFIPIMFYFTEDGEYVPLIARYIAFGLQVLLFVFMTVYTLIRVSSVSEQEKLSCRAVGISGLVMILFIALQTQFALLPFYAIGCLVSTCIIHSFVQMNEKVIHNQELGSVKQMAFKDPLTNVRNKNAYAEAKKNYDAKIWDKTLREIGLVVFDVNDLKKVNDGQGHEAGDRLIQEASRMICETYKHSPVFRIGGDEFVALLEGEDYRNRGYLLRIFNEKADSNKKFGGAVVSAGMDIFDFDRDLSIDDIFERADLQMYERKKELKSRHVEK